MFRLPNGSYIVSNDHKNFVKDVHKRCAKLNIVPLLGDVHMHVVWYRERRVGDIDSRLKCLLDALNGILYADDKQISKLCVERDDSDPKNPRMEVMVRDAIIENLAPTND